MGNTAVASFNCDRQKYSKGAAVQLACAVFIAQTTSNVAFFLKDFSDPHTRLKSSNVSCKFKLDFGTRAIPVFGYFDREQNIDDLWIPENPEVTYWDMAGGHLYIRGKKEPEDLPECKPGSHIEISANTKSGQVNIKVTNPGESLIEKQVYIPGLTSDVLGFVGAIQTGRKQIKFQLLSGDDETRRPSTEEDLVDVTDKTNFEESFGIINVSHDRKSLSRTSTQQGNGCSLLNRMISTGIHRFKLSISVDFGASLCIGIARYPFRLSEEYVKDQMKHLYRHPGLLVWRSYRGLLYIDGKQQDRTTEALGWQHGNSIAIELVVNMDERTVEILKNDRSLGIIFTDIPEVVQPVVCFYAAYEKHVQLLSYKATKSAVIKPVVKPRSSLVRTLSQTTAPIPSKVRFDHNKKYGHMSLTIDEMTIFREKNQSGNSFCMLNVTCDRNCQYRFSFVIENDQGASVCIGVTEAGDSQSVQTAGVGNIYSSPSLYVFRSFQGMLYNKGKELAKHFEEYWMTGTLIEMIVDVSESEAIVQYSINGSDQGIAFTGLQPPLKPLVGFYAGMEKRVTLIHFEHKQKRSVSRPEPESPNSFSLRSTELRQSANVSLPILLKSLSLPQYYSTCMTCGKPCDSIALPCKHSFMCAEHLSEHISQFQSCLFCDKRIEGMWNILRL